MKVLITGANGFVGRNLIVHLSERDDIGILTYTRANDEQQLAELVAEADFIFHLAGVNRPQDPAEFIHGNTDLTARLCEAIRASEKEKTVVYTSSTQAELENPYGKSKQHAEQLLTKLAAASGTKVHIFRLPNIFGKWARPNYNSAVATFCNNISQGLPIQINDPDANIKLVYIDDVIAAFVDILDGVRHGDLYESVSPQYFVTVGEIARQIEAFRSSRANLISEPVGIDFTRALYSTYISYLRPHQFVYKIPKYEDPRGVFSEMLKTKDSGQFSYFTAHPGVTRGGHYHHTKTEKFLVIKGNARFRFQHMVSNEYFELFTTGGEPEVVETIPGWTHDITNVGEDEMIVMLWANEIFDRQRPDTYASSITNR